MGLILSESSKRTKLYLSDLKPNEIGYSSAHGLCMKLHSGFKTDIGTPIKGIKLADGEEITKEDVEIDYILRSGTLIKVE